MISVGVVELFFLFPCTLCLCVPFSCHVLVGENAHEKRLSMRVVRLFLFLYYRCNCLVAVAEDSVCPERERKELAVCAQLFVFCTTLICATLILFFFFLALIHCLLARPSSVLEEAIKNAQKGFHFSYFLSRAALSLRFHFRYGCIYSLGKRRVAFTYVYFVIIRRFTCVFFLFKRKGSIRNQTMFRAL